MDAITLKTHYVYNLIYISIFDYDKYYNELYKNAIKYGMTKKQFWEEIEWQDYYVYEEAYVEKLHEQTHIQGYYNYIAFSTIYANMFSKDKSKAENYPTLNLYLQSKENNQENKVIEHKVKITKENLDKVYQNRLANCY